MFGSNRHSKLLAPEGEGSGGGGDSGDGQPKTLTEEDVGRIVNSAVTSQLKRALPTAIADSMKGVQEQLSTSIAELVAKTAKPPEKQPDGKDGEDAKSPPKEIQRQLEALSSKLEASEKARLEEQRQRLDVERQSRESAARSAFRTALQPKLKPDLLDVATDHFASKLLKVGEDGAVTLTIQRAPYKGAPTEDTEVPLADAIPEFLASPNIKPFLPAPGGHQEGGKAVAKTRRTTSVSQGASPADATLEAFEAEGLNVDDIF